ncbi:TIGR00730 family Rossman fold protein [Weissella diestrammenae]|uniref:Cytokinin riboside 5'-monophosphate phosphoribohydrolase n=1 Tax=Weissella diestrammenae TaxID=1162633 RepID=A0A7G9T6Q2_9LACO|nr:TIGR00730 family Rossman fold protein [Weissella diestrammenae]MCM0582937.1 TIGR00730 family Rossman fold protein [Weissella diestrammenae]QNN75777.1 TIGR00730 family Rossman fold protein [Weissella diestrammenae]
MKIQKIGVFMGSQSGKNDHFQLAADETGLQIADRKWHLVYGGSSTGLMGDVAKAAFTNGASVTGVWPNVLLPEAANTTYITNMLKVDNMSDRKQRMFELADACVFLPGGLGTLEELGQALSWSKLNIFTKPIVILNIDGFYEPLELWIQRSQQEAFFDVTAIEQLHIFDSVSRAFEFLDTIV